LPVVSGSRKSGAGVRKRFIVLAVWTMGVTWGKDEGGKFNTEWPNLMANGQGESF
jgi:hypothetical protein